jgi:hypothetical protein
MNKIKLSILLCAAAVVALTGCSTIDKAYDKQVTEKPGAPVGTNITIVTNLVIVSKKGEVPTSAVNLEKDLRDARDEDPAAEVQEQRQRHVQVIYGPPTYTTNLVEKPAVKAGIGVVSGVVPGWGELIALGGGWLYSLYASVRNKKINQSLVRSVQAGRDFLKSTPQGQELDAKFKQILIEKHLDAGVADDVMALLDKYVH